MSPLWCFSALLSVQLQNITRVADKLEAANETSINLNEGIVIVERLFAKLVIARVLHAAVEAIVVQYLMRSPCMYAINLNQIAAILLFSILNITASETYLEVSEIADDLTMCALFILV